MSVAGRQIKPIGRFRWVENAEFTSEGYRWRVAGEELTLEFLLPAAEGLPHEARVRSSATA